jgi:transcriptional regulator with XRE-family HTH domain
VRQVGYTVIALALFVGELRAARIRRGFTQAEVAEMVGVNLRSVCGWETGSVVPSVSNLGWWADSVGLEIPDAVRRAYTADRCGSSTGYRRHMAGGTEPCGPCRDANAAAVRRWRKTGSTLPAEVGT